MNPIGINDWVASKTDGDKLPQAADAVIEEIKLLARPPTNARDFLVTDDYGRSIHDASGDAYKLKIYNALGALHLNSSLNFAFVDFAPIWDGVLGTTPGYAAFGYKSDGNCTVDFTTTVGACDGEFLSTMFLFPFDYKVTRSGPHILCTFH